MEAPSDGYLTGPSPPLTTVASTLGWLLFLVLCAVIGVAVVRLRKAVPPVQDRGSLDDPDDLDRLGLSAARPATARPEPEGEPARVRPSDPILPPARSRPAVEAPRPGGVRLSDDAPWLGRAVPLLLSSLSAHTRGAVAVVRHDGSEYRVLARTDGGPLAPVRRAALDVDGPDRLEASRLDGLSTLVGGAAQAVPMGDYTVLMGGSGQAVEPYLSLLADLTPGVDKAPAPSRPASAPSVPSAPPVAEAAPVPRAVLIEQEQEAARADGRQLAFALVTLADAEERLTQDDPAEVAQAEAALRARLEDAEGVRRVEPFGDLLFGAFVDRDAAGMADWCTALSAAEPPLFIGAVAPADGEPGAVRDAAAEALRDAYERRGTQIVEV